MTDLASLSDEELLSRRLCDLGLSDLGELAWKARRALERELDAAGLSFRPEVWLSDEWFCPDGVAGFAIPFYLAHPRLRRLERKMMLEVEGGTIKSCLRLMRHETGHAVDNAYDLRGSRGRRRLFGSSSTPYPEFYAPVPFTKKFVRHLPDGYAQSHPDEDFAETFAVWLDPDSRWRERYQTWPAIAKLRYVDRLIGDVRGGRNVGPDEGMPDQLDQVKHTLAEHYRVRREQYRIDFAEHYDADLGRIFAREGETPAPEFLRRHRKALRRHVARWTNARHYAIDCVLRDWIARTKERKLFARDEVATAQDAATALALRVVEYLRGGHYRVAM